jgi:transposase
MHDKHLYAAILGIRDPFQVSDVELKLTEGEVRVIITAKSEAQHACPECGKNCPGYDTRRRSWRHLDTCQLKTLLVADVPRIECKEHGIRLIKVPWAEPNSGFTALMECLIIDWLREASIAAVARRLRLSWDAIDGVMQRAVKRGLARRKHRFTTHMGVDETSFQKRHEYVTVVTNLLDGLVLYVADGRHTEALDSYYESLSPEELAAIEAIAMDMCPPYLNSTLNHVPNAESKIAFDRYHVSQLLNSAVNTVRKQENRELAAKGWDVPKNTKYVWTQNPENMPPQRRRQFKALVHSSLKAARAWAIKEAARWLWKYSVRGWAVKAWKRWIGWAMRSQLGPMKRVAATIRDRLWGIINAIILNVTNAPAESVNAKIQGIKKRACGFRSRERFRNAIYFHCSGLDLYPSLETHTNA